MGPQPPSLPHTGASRRARRSPFADRTKGVWCRLPPQLLSRYSYAWFWPSFYWKLRTHSATRFFAAPDMETRFPCLQTSSGPRHTWEYVQDQGNAPEIPERAVVLGGDRFRRGWGFLGLLYVRGGDYRRLVRGGDMDFIPVYGFNNVQVLLSAGQKWARQGLTPVWPEHQTCTWNSLMEI